MKEDVKKYLGLKVRAIREAAGMTQEELAATCDVSWRTISNLERGTVVPDLVMIYKISQEFNISIDEMLDNKIADNKSLSRLEKENQIIEKSERLMIIFWIILMNSFVCCLSIFTVDGCAVPGRRFFEAFVSLPDMGKAFGNRVKVHCFIQIFKLRIDAADQFAVFFGVGVFDFSNFHNTH